MNFDREKGNMPELGWQFGYVWFWVWVAVIVTGIFVWVKRKRWL
jgi:magnesium transporter